MCVPRCIVLNMQMVGARPPQKTRHRHLETDQVQKTALFQRPGQEAENPPPPKKQKKTVEKRKKKKQNGFCISGRYLKRSSLDFLIPIAGLSFLPCPLPSGQSPSSASSSQWLTRPLRSTSPTTRHRIGHHRELRHLQHQQQQGPQHAQSACMTSTAQPSDRTLHTIGPPAAIPFTSNAPCNMCPTKPSPPVRHADSNGPKRGNTDFNNSGKHTKFHGRYQKPYASPPPPAPDQPILLCCPRLALIDHHHPEMDTSWRELQIRHMDWASTLTRTTNEWQPEWVCLRCNTAVTPNDLTMDTAEPPPTCPFHGPRRLAIDLRHNERGWVCRRGLPPHILQCEPARVNTPAPPSTHPTPGRRQWERRGPPRDGQAIPHANSLFYVPLLLAGANHLHPETAQEWRAHPQAGPEWQNLVTQLREAPAIPWQRLHHTLQTLQQLALGTNHELPPAETALVEQLAAAGSREPAGAQIHLPFRGRTTPRCACGVVGFIPCLLGRTCPESWIAGSNWGPDGCDEGGVVGFDSSMRGGTSPEL